MIKPYVVLFKNGKYGARYTRFWFFDCFITRGCDSYPSILKSEYDEFQLITDAELAIDRFLTDLESKKDRGVRITFDCIENKK